MPEGEERIGGRMEGKSEVDSSARDGQVKRVRTKTVFDIHSCPEG